MRKPSDYDSAKAYTGDFEKIVPGGYICVIQNAKEEVNNGHYQLAIAFDIAEGDLAGYYRRRFDRFGGKWPGIYRQNVVDANDKCSPFFKGMITAIEESNPGFLFDFNDEKCLVKKRFGAVFAEEEFMTQDGEIKTAVKCVQIRSVAAIRNGEFKVPEKKLCKPAASQKTDAFGFTESALTEECPF